MNGAPAFGCQAFWEEDPMPCPSVHLEPVTRRRRRTVPSRLDAEASATVSDGECDRLSNVAYNAPIIPARLRR